MSNAIDYLEKTRSAVALLFQGIDSYMALLRDRQIAFCTSYDDLSDWEAQWIAWQTENQERIQESHEAMRKYLAEVFAKSMLCGAVLQIAAKAIECYSTNSDIPRDWSEVIGRDQKVTKFCVGRLVRDVPLGLIIYAGRNQHTHFDDDQLRKPTPEVFRRLAENHGHQLGRVWLDPAFDLTDCKVSLADNVTALIGWRSLDAYESDMRTLLEA